LALVANPFSACVVARLLDFFDARTQWHRRLWVIGSILALKEIVELHADEAVVPEVRLAARRELIPSLARDVGLGTHGERTRLNELLGDKAKFPGLSTALLQIGRLTDLAERDYLANWAAALASGGTSAGAERTARYLAAHLVDRGSSPDHLHRWWKRWAIKEPDVYTLDELLLKLDAELSGGARRYAVLVFLERFADFGQGPEGLIAPAAVPASVRALGFDASLIPSDATAGAVKFEVQALDPGAAIEKVSARLDAFGARIAVGQRDIDEVRDLFRVSKDALVQGVLNPIALWQRRRVEIHEIARSRLLFARGGGAIDSALELVSYLDRSAPAAAVAGAWAAVESTLKGPASAADAARLASSIAAASYPRAELTSIAKSRGRQRPMGYLGRAIWDADSNRERAYFIAEWIRTGVDLEVSRPSDVAAVERMRAVIAQPPAELATMRSHMMTTMLRLYRQRNLVMHGGRTDAVALKATLRAAAPIVGAAFDRIAHAIFVEKVGPLSLGAQAELALELVAPGDSDRLTSLLEP
jgi:hypothetical protein